MALCCSLQFELILLRRSVKICVCVRAFCVCVYVSVSISAALGATGAGWGACNDACAATPASPYSPTICGAPAAGLSMTLGLLTRFLRALRTAPGGSGLFLCPAGLPGKREIECLLNDNHQRGKMMIMIMKTSGSQVDSPVAEGKRKEGGGRKIRDLHRDT